MDVVMLENVYVAYSGSDKPAIIDINLNVELGELVLITGPNGAGKTTLVETCLGLLKPLRGRAFLLGINTKSSKIVKVRRQCSYVPQNFMKPPYESYTVEHVIKLGLASFKLPFESQSVDEKERIEEVANLLGIQNLLNKPIGMLSGGQQQRVVIARALIRRPKVLFLDEPFSSLDYDARTHIAKTIKSYVEEHRASAIIVSHDINPVVKLVDKIVKMRNGRIVKVHSRG